MRCFTVVVSGVRDAGNSSVMLMASCKCRDGKGESGIDKIKRKAVKCYERENGML